MGRLASTLPVKAAQRAFAKLERRVSLPELKVAMVSKTQAMSMAIIDYVMMAVSRWIRSGYSTDPKNRAYRAYREVEPTLSLLFSLEQGRIASRKMDLH
jgi:hypothetical protein